MLAVVACGTCLALHTPLCIVAAASSIAAAVSWAVGLGYVRRSVGAVSNGSARRFAVAIVWQSAALLLTLSVVGHWMLQMLIYAAIAVTPTWRAAHAAHAHPARGR